MKPIEIVGGVIHFKQDPKAEKIKIAKATHSADVEALQGKLTDEEQNVILLRILERLEALEN